MTNNKEIKNDGLTNKDFYDQILEDDKKTNPTKPCDPSSPNYPWEPCGLNNDKK